MEKAIITPYESITTGNFEKDMVALWAVYSHINNYILQEYALLGFEWGQRDCHTLVLDIHDYIHGSNYSKQVKGQYDDPKSALKFMRNWMDTHVWLKRAGYAITDDFQDFAVVAIRQHQHFATGGICLNGNIIFHRYTDDNMLNTELSYMSYKQFVDAMIPYTVWSK